jgi:accessory gene regulator B
MIKFVKNYSDKLVTNKVIKAEDQELYSFGLQQGLLIILNLLTTVFIGIIFGMILESVLFLVSYIPLRSFAGGYHAKTPLKCYFLSLILLIIVLLAVKYIIWTNYIIIGVSLISGLIIFFLAPVEDINKPLDIIEVKVFKKRTKQLLSIELIIIILFLVIRQNIISTCISVSLFTLSIMLIMGLVKNKIKKRYENIISEKSV